MQRKSANQAFRNKETEVSFQAKPQRLHVIDEHEQFEHVHDDEHADGGGHGGTEMGWLVSYADMMTLLFGLFVILFSMMVKSPAGSADRVMQEVSKQYFGGTTDAPTPVSAPVSTPQPTPQPTPETPSQPTPRPTAEPTPATPTSDPHELEVAKEKITGLESKVTELATKLQQAEAQAKNAGKGNPPSEIAKDEQIASLESTLEKLQSNASSLEKKLTAEKADKSALQKALENEKSKSPQQNYMATTLVWPSEKHDLDLVIVDPSGNKFDFKRRAVKNRPGHFEIDSRFGPGIEMWKAVNFTVGTYRAMIKLYSKNGNEAPAAAHFSIITNLSTYQSPEIVLKAQGEQTEVVFTIDAAGAVEFKK